MSAIIISAILLIVAVTGSLTGFFQRSNILDSELKSRSSAVADACADHALLLIANDATFTNSASPILFTFNSLDSCRVFVSDTPPYKSVKVQATSSNAVTNLTISYDPAAPAILSWEEIPTL